VCDLLWFRKELKSHTTNHVAVLRTEFYEPNLAEFSVCNTCRRSLNSKRIPLLAKLQLVETLCTVSQDDLPNPEMYANQVHCHTVTCTKRGETNMPYWTMNETRVLLPMAKDDNRRSNYQSKAKKLRQLLEEKRYNSLGEFLVDAISTMWHYLDIIRATL
jgi:hypothetical protein